MVPDLSVGIRRMQALVAKSTRERLRILEIAPTSILDRSTNAVVERCRLRIWTSGLLTWLTSLLRTCLIPSGLSGALTEEAKMRLSLIYLDYLLPSRNRCLCRVWSCRMRTLGSSTACPDPRAPSRASNRILPLHRSRCNIRIAFLLKPIVLYPNLSVLFPSKLRARTARTSNFRGRLP